MTNPDRDERYKAQTSEQFEALGCFIQSFELMVDAARNTCRTFLDLGDPKHQQLVHVILYHQSMTAQPLFDIMRALYAQQVQNYPEVFPEDEAKVIDDVLTYCATEYSKLVSLRNDLIHGTWHIGWANPAQDDFSEMHVYKFKVGKAGYTPAKLPKTAAELRAETARIDALAKLINHLSGAYLVGIIGATPPQSRVRLNVRKEGNRWVPGPPDKPSAPKV